LVADYLPLEVKQNGAELPVPPSKRGSKAPNPLYQILADLKPAHSFEVNRSEATMKWLFYKLRKRKVACKGFRYKTQATGPRSCTVWRVK